MPPERNAARAIRQFESEVGDLRESAEPMAARATVLTLAAFVLVAGVAMAFARVDRVVSSVSGKIVSVEAPSVFQALDASIVKSVDVREGQVVEAGALLATLDPTFAAADVNQLRQQIKSLDAQIARNEAELARDEPNFAASDDAETSRYQALQLALFRQRAAQVTAQLASFDEKIAQTQATIDKFQGDEGRYRERLQIADQVETMRSTLQQHGVGTLLNVLVSTDAKLEALRTMEFGHNSLLEAEHQMASLKADQTAFIEQWRSSVSGDLVTARNARDGAASLLEKAVKHQDLVRLTAPTRAMVLTLAKISAGSVLKEGDTLMVLAPMNSPLEAEVDIASRDIGFVRAGDPAALKIDAFDFSEHGVAEGTVRSISEDAFTTDENGAPTPAFYRARIAIDSVKFVDVPRSFRLIPGMTLSADVKVGTRSLGLYLIGGLVHGAGESMREP